MSAPAGNGWNRTIAGATALFACALIFISAGFAWQFGHLLGTAIDDKRLWGAFGVAIILLKPTLTFILKAAKGHGVARFGLGVLLFGCVAYSSYATYAYRVAIRGETALQTENQSDLRARLRALGSPREASVIRPLIEKSKTSKAWSASSECEDATRKETISHCQTHRELEAELAASVKAEELREKIFAGRKGPTVSEREIFGLSEVAVAAIVVAAILELSELLLLYGASILWSSGGRIDQEEVHLPPGQTPAALPAKRAVRKSAIQLWFDQYLGTKNPSDVISAASAYAAYAAEWKERKKRPLKRLAFGDTLNKALIARGFNRWTDDGRLYYQLQAPKAKSRPA